MAEAPPDPLIVTCPACAAANRVPRARLGQGSCDKCKAPLFQGGRGVRPGRNVAAAPMM
jgi:thioredoxin 2